MDGGDLARTQIVSTVEGSRRRLQCVVAHVMFVFDSETLFLLFFVWFCFTLCRYLCAVFRNVCTSFNCSIYHLSSGPAQLPTGKPPLPSQAVGNSLALSNATPSASYPPPLMAGSSSANSSIGDQQNWLWKYRLSASRYLLFFSGN